MYLCWQLCADGVSLSFDKINSGCQKNGWDKLRVQNQGREKISLVDLTTCYDIIKLGDEKNYIFEICGVKWIT